MKRIFCAAALCGLLLAAAAQAGIEKAEQYMEQGRYREALVEIDGLLDGEPANAEAWFLKGVILTRDNQLDRAAEVFTRMTRDYPDLPEPYNNLAVIYAVQGEHEKSRDALIAAIKTHPSYATAHENLGDIYTQMASAAYGRALKLDSENRSAKAKLAMINGLFSSPGGNGAAAAPVDASGAKVVNAVQGAAPPAGEPPAATAGDEAVMRAEITGAIEAWAVAWSGKDADAYLAHYAPSFRPTDGSSRSNWAAVRRKRLAKPRFIRVRIEQPRVRIDDGDHAIATFRQLYEADLYQDSVRKTLGLVRQDGRWLITSEAATE